MNNFHQRNVTREQKLSLIYQINQWFKVKHQMRKTNQKLTTHIALASENQLFHTLNSMKREVQKIHKLNRKPTESEN